MLHKQYSGDQIRNNTVGEAYSTHGEDDSCIQGFGAETVGKEITWKT